MVIPTPMPVMLLGGINVASQGQCPPSPCSVSEQCIAAGEYCAKDTGHCDQDELGYCVAKPTICPLVYNPICGCDGNTYTNACHAALGGINVASQGQCPPSPCSVNEQCIAAGEYCAKDTGYCDPDELGYCVAKPTICPLIYNPICGCDGNTYTNACHAALGGVNVASQGQCPPSPCSVNEQCIAAGEYCAKDTGYCGPDELGYCVAKPTICPLIYNPICGCDGNTYPNACHAALGGINVASQGQCPPSPCSVNEQCIAAGEYCAKDTGYCDQDELGYCVAKPTICPLVYNPICGCDGNTYTNACHAALGGINVASQGQCPPPPCIINADCNTEIGEYCAKDTGYCNLNGYCASKPVVCPDIIDPICGCDGNTYENACRAAFNGTNVASQGQCPPSRCMNSTDCNTGAGEYCAKSIGNCDQSGYCAATITGCPDIIDPICGCDGNAYTNACVAAATGVNVASAAPCLPTTCFINQECTDAEYCAKAAGSCDEPGNCAAKPPGCPEIWNPICGCDGNTYANACVAAANGVNAASSGQCCRINEDC